ncbi:MAG: glycosyltransferase family 39 protein [Solirubrobacteraceae bacterium]
MTATVAAPQRADPDIRRLVPDWILRLPLWVRVTAFLLVLIGVSLYLRTRYLGGQFWMDEALAVGISSHSLSAIPGVLRHDGSPPLYYLLLHIWMTLFGSSEVATHTLSLLFGLLTIPVGMWAGWSLLSKRAGVYAAVLFAFSAFITQYSQETRMYSLMTLLGLIATAGFMHGFVYRRRRYVALFAVAQALMLYTHAWGIFFGAASVLALALLYRLSDERQNLLKDAVLAYAGVGVLFAPWLPNFLYQATHTAAPWDTPPRFGAPIQLSRNVLGGDRVAVVLVGGALIGLAGLMARRSRRTIDAKLMWVLIVISAAALVLAWISSQITPAWVPRYFAPIVGPILLLIAFGLARAGAVGLLALVLSVVFLANQASYSTKYKSDVRIVGSEIGAKLHRGDLVIVGQPEQTPLAYYYLPAGLRFANTSGGIVADPTYMNWVGALARIKSPGWRATAIRLIDSVKPGQQLLFIRPLTEGAQNWQAPWTIMVRRRSAQWGAIIAADKQLVPAAVSPHNYPGACCVADSAVLYEKVR